MEEGSSRDLEKDIGISAKGKAGQGHQADISKINSTAFVGSNLEKPPENNSVNVSIV